MVGRYMQGLLGVRAVELLCSRLCHDLVGPVGAVNNGVELLDEAGVGDGEALDLIAGSAETAAARLRLYRLALGAAGGQAGVAPADGRAALEGWFRSGTVRLEWSVDLSAPPAGLVKVILLTALLAEESLPRGGVVRVQGDDRGVSVSAIGTGAALRPEMLEVLAGRLGEDALGPRSVLSYVAPRFAAAYGIELTPPVTGAAPCFSLTLAER
jgi:histidine phosphotransferase ChpT